MPAQVYRISSMGAPIQWASMPAVPWTLWHRPLTVTLVSRCIARHSMAMGFV